MSQAELGTIAATALKSARDTCHRAAQWATKAARANLQARADDSHSNLGWDASRNALVSHPLQAAGAPDVRVGLALTDLRLLMIREGELVESLALGGLNEPAVGEWLDGKLAAVGLAAASDVELPYELPEGAANSEPYDGDASAPERAELVRWYSLAAASLARLAAEFGEQASPVRCWPHHFDIATLVSLEEGDAETARSIGIGMSPGDGSYAQPYFYVNPWPHLSREGLPALSEPGRWHVEGWVGAVATGERVLAAPDRGAALASFLRQATESGKKALGY